MRPDARKSPSTSASELIYGTYFNMIRIPCFVVLYFSKEPFILQVGKSPKERLCRKVRDLHDKLVRKKDNLEHNIFAVFL